jgi:hypothetical protein
VIPKFLTNALIQNVRTTVRKEIFGDPDQNLTYLPKLEEVLREAGHDFEICTKTSDQVKKRLLEVVLQEKIQSLKKLNRTMSKEDKLKYLENWEELNLDLLQEGGLGTPLRDDSSGPISTSDEKR